MGIQGLLTIVNNSYSSMVMCYDKLSSLKPLASTVPKERGSQIVLMNTNQK